MRADREESGRWWIVLTVVLSGSAAGPLGYLWWQWLQVQSGCYDVQGDVDTQRQCDGYAANIAAGSRVVLIVAALAVVTMLPVGVTDGGRGLTVAQGPARPLLYLVVSNPAAFAGYLTGWVLGRVGRVVGGSARRIAGDPGH